MNALLKQLHVILHGFVSIPFFGQGKKSLGIAYSNFAFVHQFSLASTIDLLMSSFCLSVSASSCINIFSDMETESSATCFLISSIAADLSFLMAFLASSRSL